MFKFTGKKIAIVRNYCSRSTINLKYNDEQLKRIIAALNEGSLEDIQTISSKENAEKIIQYRKQIGNYNSLQQLLQVEGVPLGNLKKLCDQLCAVKKPAQLKNVCIPTMPKRMKEQVKNVTAITLNPLQLSWAQIQRHPFQLCSWQQIKLCEDTKPKPLHTLFEMALRAFEELPQTDAFIIEQLPTQVRQQTGMQHLLNLTSLQAMLISLLNDDYRLTNEHKVYTMKPHIITRYFQLGLGGERVSCTSLVLQLLEKASETNFDNLIVSQNLIEKFMLEKSTNKEELGTTLLLALSFLDLVVNKK